jgi:hypothetical protein
LPSSLHEKSDQRGGGRQMKQDMRSIWDHSIARRQEGMRFAEHDFDSEQLAPVSVGKD